MRRAPQLQSVVTRATAAPNAAEETEVKLGWWQRQPQPNMIDITSAQQLVDILDANRDKLVILDVYAKWCGACKSLYPKLAKLCKENPDIVLCKVDYDVNRDMCKKLGIKVLPFFQLYRGSEGKVQEFSCNASKFQRFRDALLEYGPARCSLGLPPVLQEIADLLPHAVPEQDDASAVKLAAGENNVVAAPARLAKKDTDAAAAAN